MTNLDGAIQKAEHNYMTISKQATDEGKLEKIMQQIDPGSPYTVEQAGSKAFPSGHGHEKDAPKVNAEGIGKERSNTNDDDDDDDDDNDGRELPTDEEIEVDPELDLLLEEGEYAERHHEAMILEEDGYDEKLITQYERIQPKQKHESASGAVSTRLVLIVLNVLAGFLMLSL